MLVMVNVNWNALGFRENAFKKMKSNPHKASNDIQKLHCLLFWTNTSMYTYHFTPPTPIPSTHTQSSHQQAYTLFIQYTPVAELHCEHPHWAMGSWPCPAQAGCRAPPCTAVTPAWTWGHWAGVSAQTPADMYTEGQSCEAQHDRSLGQPENNKEI